MWPELERRGLRGAWDRSAQSRVCQRSAAPLSGIAKLVWNKKHQEKVSSGSRNKYGRVPRTRIWQALRPRHAGTNGTARARKLNQSSKNSVEASNEGQDGVKSRPDRLRRR